MNASELRIGNIVQRGDGEIIRISANDIRLSDMGYSYRGIPLTVEIAEQSSLNVCMRKDENKFLLFGGEPTEAPCLLEIEAGYNKITIDGITFCMDCLYYLHHLQNLVFALTGKELTVNI